MFTISKPTTFNIQPLFTSTIALPGMPLCRRIGVQHAEAKRVPGAQEVHSDGPGTRGKLHRKMVGFAGQQTWAGWWFLATPLKNMTSSMTG